MHRSTLLWYILTDSTIPQTWTATLLNNYSYLGVTTIDNEQSFTVAPSLGIAFQTVCSRRFHGMQVSMCKTKCFLSFFLQEKPKPGKSSAAKKYHSQYYVNGTQCDLTGKERETQIKVL